MRKATIIIVLFVISCGDNGASDPTLTQGPSTLDVTQTYDSEFDVHDPDIFTDDLAVPEDEVSPDLLAEVQDSQDFADQFDAAEDFVDAEEADAEAVDAEPTIVRVSVQSEPPGAWAVVDNGFYQDYTPYDVFVPTGHHDFEYSMDGYHGKTLGVNVNHDDFVVFAMLEQEDPESVMVTVTSTPSGVPVVINSGEYGPHNTDFEIDLLPGSYTFNYYPNPESGYLSVSIQETISADNSFVHVDLQKVYDVHVSSEPAGAELTIDGVQGYSTPVDVQVLEGERQVFLHHPSDQYYDIDQAITVDADNTNFNFVFEAKPLNEYVVTFSSEPSGAQLTVDGTSQGTTPVDLTLTEGDHDVYLYHPSDQYYDIDQPVMVDADNTNFNFVFEELPPDVYAVGIDISPVGSTVLIDGSSADLSNLTLAEGCHDIQISHFDYDSVDDQICVDADNTDFSFTLTLTEFTVTVSSMPSGAELTLDGVTGYITPAQEFLTAGTYSVFLHLDGYQDIPDTIEVHQDQISFEFLLTPLVPDTYDVTIDTDPTGANMVLDGSPGFTTPANVTLTEGPHDLVLGADGYQTKPYQIYVDAANTDFLIPLDPVEYEVVIDSVPTGAALTFDGTPGYTTPVTLMLTAGSYDLLLEYPGYDDKPETIVVDADSSFVFTMDQTVHDVTIDSMPSGAELTIDGTPGYTTPAQVSLTEEDHDIFLHHPFDIYDDIVDTITVDSANTSFQFTFDLKQYNVHIDSDPSGASLTVAGIFSGTTPADVVLTHGFHNVLLVLPGYNNYPEQIEVNASNTDFMFTMTPESPDTVSVNVTSTPSGATVIVDQGTHVDTTPFTVDLTQEIHQFDFSLAGHFPKPVNEDIGQTTTVHADLMPIPVMVNVTVMSNPMFSNCTIDGEATVYTTPFAVELEEGDHSFQCYKGTCTDNDFDFFVDPVNNYVYFELTNCKKK